MKNNVLTVIGIILIVAGAAISYFAKIPFAELTGFASVMFGAGLVCANLWNKRDKSVNNWMYALSIVLVGMGCFIVGFFGLITESTVITIITSAVGFVAIIAGLLIPVITKYEE